MQNFKAIGLSSRLVDACYAGCLGPDRVKVSVEYLFFLRCRRSLLHRGRKLTQLSSIVPIALSTVVSAHLNYNEI